MACLCEGAAPIPQLASFVRPSDPARNGIGELVQVAVRAGAKSVLLDDLVGIDFERRHRRSTEPGLLKCVGEALVGRRVDQDSSAGDPRIVQSFRILDSAELDGIDPFVDSNSGVGIFELVL